MRKVFKLVEIQLDELKRGDLFMLYDVNGGPENLDKLYLARSAANGSGESANVLILNGIGALLACRDTEIERSKLSG